jgi:hypothetical protein
MRGYTSVRWLLNISLFELNDLRLAAAFFPLLVNGVPKRHISLRNTVGSRATVGMILVALKQL